MDTVSHRVLDGSCSPGDLSLCCIVIPVLEPSGE